MARTEERLTHLEVKVEEHSMAMGDLKGLIVALDQKMERRFDAFEQRVDRRFAETGQRLDRIDQRFVWVIGIQFTIFLSIAAGMFGLVTMLLRR